MALEGDETGHVKTMRLAHNKLVATDTGTLRPKATGETEEIPVGLVFRFGRLIRGCRCRACPSKKVGA